MMTLLNPSFWLSSRRTVATLGLALLINWSGIAMGENAPAETDRETSLVRMRSLLETTSLKSGPTESERTGDLLKRPILRYTNPATPGVGEGSTFLWLEGQRPLAAASPSLRENGMWWELSSLSDKPLQLERDGRKIWSPESCSLASAPFPGADEPAATEAARLVQMRNLSRQVEVRENRREQWQDGRLLTQPLYRWSDAGHLVVDGALFGFAETTDPELLLLLEARKDQTTGKSAWHFALAKMTCSAVIVSIGGKEVWSEGNFWKEPRKPGESYVEAQVAEPDQPPAAQSTPNSK